MANLQLRTVTKRFGTHLAVSDVTFEVRDGEFVVLVGPSGCGKTTVLRVIAGLEEIGEGELRIVTVCHSFTRCGIAAVDGNLSLSGLLL